MAVLAPLPAPAGADVAGDAAAWHAAPRVLCWAMAPGDAVLFHFRAVHGAGGVAGGGRRRVLSLRVCGEDVTHAPRPWRTSPHFEGLEAELPAGAPLEHPRFPVLWERAAGAAAGV